MTIMAASMGYMFAGMQLMMALPPQSQQFAQQQQPAPQQQSVSRPGPSESGLQTMPRAPKAAACEPLRPPAETSPPPLAKSYTIAAGDSLQGIAARIYGDARQWRSLMKANPGLDPRRLRIGQMLKLPGRTPPGRACCDY